MKGIVLGLALTLASSMAVAAEEPPAEQVPLKNGSTLYLHPDGTSRMADMHGKRMTMRDGEEMETAHGEMIMMKNKKVWVQYGPAGKGGRVLKTD